MAYADADGVKLYWETGGSGEPLLLIQGLGFSAAMWYRILPRLEERYRVIRFDARGIGRSDAPDGPYPIELMASDAASVLDAAEVDRAHVFAVSLGGIVGQELAISYPARVRSLMLCSTHPAGAEAAWPDSAIIVMLQERTKLPPEESIRAAVNVGYAPTTPRAWIDEDVARRLELPNTVAGYQNQLMGGLNYPGTLPRLRQVDVPALVMAGDLDEMVPPSNVDILADALPNARRLIFEGVSHVVFTDAPDTLVDAMLSFLDEVSVDARG
jgi:pimeloyl-ACP methyl ester carboxylesterase